LGLEPLNENDYTDYSVIKYFYSKIEPLTFINLIDKSDWTTKDLVYGITIVFIVLMNI
jgi:hypothetical protein